MAIGSSAICGTYKREINAGIHFWTSHSRGDGSTISADTFKIALFTNSSSLMPTPRVIQQATKLVEQTTLRVVKRCRA